MDKIFSWIGDLFTKIWKIFKKVLPYIMIALAVFFTFGGSIVLMGMVLEGYAAAIAAMGLSFLVAPEETTDVVTGVTESVSNAAGAIVAAGVGGLASGLFGGESSWLLIAAVAVGAYFLFSKGGEDEEEYNKSSPRDKRRDDGSDNVVVGSTELDGDENLWGERK